MIKLILIVLLNLYAAIPVMNKSLLPGSEPLPAQEIEVNEPWIIIERKPPEPSFGYITFHDTFVVFHLDKSVDWTYWQDEDGGHLKIYRKLKLMEK